MDEATKNAAAGAVVSTKELVDALQKFGMTAEQLDQNARRNLRRLGLPINVGVARTTDAIDRKPTEERSR